MTSDYPSAREAAPGTVQFIAHRGESADAPENTMAAFRLAWERGIACVELDVHLTRDGELVVCHDADTLRTTGVAGAICEHTVAQLLRLDAGAWKGPQWAGQPIPSLSAVLAEMPAESRALVEIKVGPEAVPALARTVAASGLSADRITAISFNAGTVAAARRLLPGHRAYLLGGLRRKGDATPPETAPDRLIREAVAIGAHGLNLGVDDAIDGAFVRRVEAAGLALYVWTVDDAPTARRLIAAGVDGITSNRAAALRVECGAGP